MVWTPSNLSARGCQSSELRSSSPTEPSFALVDFDAPFLPSSTSAKSENRSEKRSTRRVQRCVGRRAAMVGSRNGSRKSGGYTDGAARSACGSARPPGRLARRLSPARVATFVPSIKASGVTSLSVSSTGIIDFLRPRRARTRQEVAVAARSRAGGAARRRFPTLESGSAVRVGSVAGRSSRRRRLVSGRRRREAAEGARSCCSTGAMSTRVSRSRAASWSSIGKRESRRCSGTTCRRGGPGATARSGLLTTARGHRRSFLTSRRLRRASAREREKLRAPGLVCCGSFSTLYPTRRQRLRAVQASPSNV